MTEGDQFLELEGTRLRWRLEGSGGAPLLVLIHGWALDLDYWDAVVPLLRSRFHVLRYDRRGFGASTGPPDPASEWKDVVPLIDAAGAPSATLIGMSQGARVAIRATLAAPTRVDSLVLDGAPLLEGESELQIGRYLAILREDGESALRAAIRFHPLMQLQCERAPGSEILARATGRYRGADLSLPAVTLAPPRVEDIRQPTLVINGNADLPQRRTAGSVLCGRIAGAQRVEISGAGHLAALDAPAEYAEAVLRFISGK
jgi:3-oxoadipate enol-lactonase